MVKLRLVALLALLVLGSVAAAGIGATPAAPKSKPPLFPVTVQAANGPVTITSRPTRIVSLSPTATEDLFAIGAGAQVLAVDDQSNYPSQAPRTKLSGYRPNAEAIAGYDPDLVVVSDDGGIVGSLQKLGITVLLEPAAANLGEAYGEIRQLGAATGHPVKAKAVVRTMQAGLTKVLRSVPNKSRHLRVFHELSPSLYSATSATFIGRVYKLFGFANIADAADPTKSGYPQLSAEYVISADPELVVLSDSKCCAQSAQTVAARPGWTNVTAVKRKRVIPVDDDIASRWGPRIVDFARVVANAARRP
jgi:iron complex transport system substrate-binding protein